VALIQALIANRANLNRRNQNGDSAILLAALKPELEAAKILIANGADLNPSGWTPLHYAMFSGSKELAGLFIAKGAKLDSRAPSGQTALMLAIRHKNLDMVKLLVEAGADKNLADAVGLTALGLANKLEQGDIVAYLRKLGATE
jgi:ankyrin repeat protein